MITGICVETISNNTNIEKSNGIKSENCDKVLTKLNGENIVSDKNNNINNNNNKCNGNVKVSTLNRSQKIDATNDCDSGESNSSGKENRLIDKPKPAKRHNISLAKVKSESVEKSNGEQLKPILSNSTSDSRTANYSNKKSVSFDTSNDNVTKFITGDVIIDKENPFKRLNALKRADFFTNSSVSAVQLPKEEFVTKEDVLNESKFVKTYIKNPDEYFVYDPTLKQRLLAEEARERFEKLKDRQSPPKKGSRISRLTHERLKELKNKYSPPPLYTQSKIRNVISGGLKSSLTNGEIPSQLPIANGDLKKKKKSSIDRSKYPELSQIKVKVGTDLEGSFFNPKEVALNAKKFDARIKKAQFGSQDDLDEITDLTSTFVPLGQEGLSNDILLYDNDDDEEIDTSKSIDNSIRNSSDDKTNSFSNTVNSKEFQAYLKKKGLTLLPSAFTSKTVENQSKKDNITLRIIEPGDIDEMDGKKTVKKSSVLQRLFPNGIFSSRRKTTPKEAEPEPKKLGANDDTRLSLMRKRLVLHRQSLPPQSNTTLNGTIPNGVSIDDGSSSISSALTNAENESSPASKPTPVERKTKLTNGSNSDLETPSKNLSGIRYIDSSSNSTIVAIENAAIANDLAKQQKPTPRSRNLSGRSSVPVMNVSERLEKMRANTNSVTPQSSVRLRKETPLSFENKTPDVKDGVVKPRVQRAQLPISQTKQLPGHRYIDAVTIEPKLNGSIKKIIDRPTLIIPKKNTEIKTEPIRKRTPPKLPERKTSTITTTTSNRNSVKTPDGLNETLGPKNTSTPISETVPLSRNRLAQNFYFHQRNPNISPIPKSHESSPPLKPNELDPITWAKVRELKEQADRQLYSQPLLVYTDGNCQPISINDLKRQNIYERLPIQQQEQHQQCTANVPVYAKVDKRTPQIAAQFIRNAPQRQSLDQIRIQQNFNTQSIPEQYFIRNSQQRSTVTGVCHPPNVVLHQHPISNNLLITHQQMQHPPRAQSVLDDMITGGTPQSRQTNVILRRKPAQTLSREEIMQQVTDFCRKSMNRTPTKHYAASDQMPYVSHQRHLQTSSDVSPISYASMDSKTSPSIASSRSSAKIAPQVPQRVQSLVQPMDKVDNPIYETIFKRGSLQSNASETAMIIASASSPTHNKRVSFSTGQRRQFPTKKAASETDSAFVSDENTPNNGHYQVPPRRYIVMDADKVTPTHVMKIQAGHPLVLQHPYAFVQYRDGTQAPPCSPQIYYQAVGNQLVPQSVRHSDGQIVVLENGEQLYRPITPIIGKQNDATGYSGPPKHINFVRSGNQIVPYECNDTPKKIGKCLII